MRHNVDRQTTHVGPDGNPTTNFAAQKQATPTRQHPLNNVRWVDPATLHSNSYNPNHVFSIEMQLLKTSILEDGWTQPIVARESGEIVDGFHRWSLGSLDQEVRQMSGGLVPVVVLPNKTLAEQMMSTVRHNRARGQHAILKMSDIVRGLKDHGKSDDEIREGLGMDREELERLIDQRGSPDTKGKDSFGKGWVPVAERAGQPAAVPAKTPKRPR